MLQKYFQCSNNFKILVKAPQLLHYAYISELIFSTVNNDLSNTRLNVEVHC
jgi:hypothetical protein